MQDRYVGDVGDFGKYALLRCLVSESDLRLGMHWCMYRDESHNGDGRHVAYLAREDFRQLDPALHDELRKIVSSGHRSVAAVSRSGILPSDTLHFLDHGSAPERRLSPTERVKERRSWSSRAASHLRQADIVFVDPDNGLEAKSVPEASLKAGKYVFWSDLATLWGDGHSLVVYHHLNRTMSAQDQIGRLAEEFKRRFGPLAFLESLIFRRGSCRTFWIVPQPRHSAHMRTRVEAMVTGAWTAHFERWLDPDLARAAPAPHENLGGHASITESVTVVGGRHGLPSIPRRVA